MVFRCSVDLLEEWEGFSTGLFGEVQVKEAERLAGMEESFSLSRVFFRYETVVDGVEGGNIDLLVRSCKLLRDGGAVRHDGWTAVYSSEEDVTLI